MGVHPPRKCIICLFFLCKDEMKNYNDSNKNNDITPGSWKSASGVETLTSIEASRSLVAGRHCGRRRRACSSSRCLGNRMWCQKVVAGSALSSLCSLTGPVALMRRSRAEIIK